MTQTTEEATAGGGPGVYKVAMDYKLEDDFLPKFLLVTVFTTAIESS